MTEEVKKNSDNIESPDSPGPNVKEEGVAELEKMTGSYQVTVKIGDKDYTCTSPSLKDHATFYARLRAEMAKAAEDFLKVLLRSGVSEELAVSRYEEKVRNAEPDQLTLFQATNSQNAAQYYFYVTAKDNHSEITEEVAKTLVTEKNWEEVLRVINTLNPYRESEKNVTGEKTEAAKKD